MQHPRSLDGIHLFCKSYSSAGNTGEEFGSSVEKEAWIPRRQGFSWPGLRLPPSSPHAFLYPYHEQLPGYSSP